MTRTFQPHRSRPDGTAILQCEIWVDGKTGERRCPEDAQTGSLRCSRHTRLPADLWRCRHRLSNGQRCPRAIPERRRDREHFCSPRHGVACAGSDGQPCGRHIMREDAPLCRICTARAREDAASRCWVPMGDGKACGHRAVVAAGTCRGHDPARWPTPEQRCQHRYGPAEPGDELDRGRCIRRTVHEGTACVLHGQPCEGCGRQTNLLADGVRCGRCGDRCATDGCQGFAQAGGFCTICDPTRPRCSATSRKTGKRCARPAAAGSDVCGNHGRVRPAPGVPDRDVDRGDTPRGPDGRIGTRACSSCGTATTATLGTCPTCRREETCLGMVANGARKGERCRRPAVTSAGLCQDHHDRCAPDQERCTATFRDGSDELPCTEPRVLGGDPHCRIHGGQPRCLVWRGPGAGAPCKRAPRPNGLCNKHQSVLTMDLELRCQHIYPNGSRCPQLSGAAHGNGTDQVCPQHRVACTVEGCTSRTADLVGQVCQRHRDRCRATVADGLYTRRERPCGKTQMTGHELCETHVAGSRLAEEDRCSHIFEDGSRCFAARHHASATGRGWATVCQAHSQPCVEDGCDRLTGLPGGRCREHRPVCTEHRCSRPGLSETGMCSHHHRRQVDGACALREAGGERCKNPGTVETDEGRICGWHAAHLPADEDRCQHRHDTGERCALQRWEDRGYVWCGRHSAEHGGECLELSIGTGEPCGNRRKHLPDGRLSETCDAHEPAPEELRCRGEVAPGRRCTGQVGSPFHWACGWHRAQAPRCTATPVDVPCPAPAVRDLDRCERHTSWDPEWPYESREDFERWFLTPNADLYWELVAIEAGLGAVDNDTPATEKVHNDSATADQGVRAPMNSAADELLGPEPIVDYDPYDLTGARDMACVLIEEGLHTPEEARVEVLDMARNWDPGSVRTWTSSIRGYLRFCEEHGYTPIPASRGVLFKYFNHIRDLGVRNVDGEKIRDYAPSTIDGFRNAIRQIHEARDFDDPFKKDHRLAWLVNGIGKGVARPELQAHAIRLDELGQLIQACYSVGEDQLRDLALVALLTHPDGPKPQPLADLTFDRIQFIEDQDGHRSLRISYPYRKSVKTIEIAALDDGEVVVDGQKVSARLACPVHLLQAYRLERELLAGHHLRPSDAVFLAGHGERFGHESGVRAVARRSCKKAGVAYANPLSVEDRLRVALYLGDPPALAVRDAAVMTTMWWASLRRSEVGPLTIGDLGADPHDRGLQLMIRKDKVQDRGWVVPIPRSDLGGRTQLLQDGVQVLNRWLDTYRRVLNGGQELTADMPLFPPLGNTSYGDETNPEGLKGISGDTVGLILDRYVGKTDITAELGETLTAHGFRAGAATEWLAKGGDAVPLSRHQRRKSVGSVRVYNRPRDPFEGIARLLGAADKRTATDLGAAFDRERGGAGGSL